MVQDIPIPTLTTPSTKEKKKDIFQSFKSKTVKAHPLRPRGTNVNT